MSEELRARLQRWVDSTDSSESFLELAALARAAEDNEAYDTVLRTASRRCDGPTAARLFLTLVARAGAEDRAALWGEAAACLSGQPDAVVALLELALAEADRAAIDALTRTTLADGSAPEALQVRAASLAAQWSQDPDLLVPAWRHLIEAGQHGWRDAYDALMPHAAEGARGVQTYLVGLARTAGDPRAALPLMELQLRAATGSSVGEQVSLLCALATTAAEAGVDPEMSAAYLADALERAPSAIRQVRTVAREVAAHSPAHADTMAALLQSLARRGGDPGQQLAEARAAIALLPSASRQAEALVGLVADLGPQLDAAALGELARDLIGLDPGRTSALVSALEEPVAAAPPAEAAALLESLEATLPPEEVEVWLHPLLSARAARVDSPAERASLTVRIAGIEAYALGRPELAAERVAAVLDTPHDAAEALHGMVVELLASFAGSALPQVFAFLETREDWESLATALQRAAESADAPAEAAALAVRAAAVLADRLDRPEEAAERVLFALRHAPADAGCLAFYRRLMVALDRPEEELVAVERLLRVADTPDDQASLERDRIELFLRTGRAETAFVELCRLQASAGERDERLLAACLADAEVIANLERLHGRLSDVIDLRTALAAAVWVRAHAADRLDVRLPVQRFLAAHGALDGDGLRELAAHEPDPVAAAAWLGAIPEEERSATDWLGVIEAATDPAERAMLTERAWAAWPDEREILAAMREVALASEDPAAQVAFFDRAAGLTSRSDEERAADLDALSALWRQLGRDDLAMGVDVTRLGLVHADAVVDRLRDAALDRGDYRGLHDALSESAARVPDGAPRAERERELGCLLNDRLGDRAGSTAHWRRALAHAPPGLWVRREAADRLLTLADAVERSVVPRAVQALCEEVGDENAIERLEQICLGHADDEAIDALEAVLDATAQRLPGSEAVLRPARIEAQVLRGDLSGALHALDAWEAERAPEPLPDRWRERRLGLLLGDPDGEPKAIAHICAALTASADDPLVVQALDGLPRHRQLRLRVAQTLVGDLSDPPSDSLLLRAAALAAADGDETFAAECHRALFNRAPGSVEAFRGLHEYHRRRGERDRLSQLIRDHVAAGGLELEERMALLRELATLVETPEERIAALEALLAEDPTDLDALRQLSRLYRGSETVDELARVLEALGAHEEDVDTRKRHLFSLARLEAGPRRNAEGAAAALEAILMLDPSDERATKELERSCRQREDHARWVRVLRRRLDEIEDSETRLGLLREIAHLEETALGDRAAAARDLEQVIALEPGNLSVLEELARLHAEQEDWNAHLAVLEKLATATGLAELRAEVYLRAARVLHERLSEHGRALDLLAEASKLTRLTPEAVGLARACGTQGEQWEAWGSVLKAIAEQETDPQRKAERYAELGEVLADRLDRAPAAFGLLSEVFPSLAFPMPVLALLERLAEEAGRREQLLPHYVTLRERAGDNVEMTWRALSQSASIAEQVVERPDKAFRILIEAARIGGLRARAEAELERIAGEHGLWEEHRAYLEERWQEEGDADAETEVLLRKARVEEEELDRPEEALETLIAAFQGAPFNERVRSGLYRLAGSQGAWEIVIRLLEALQQQHEGTERIALILEMATVFETRLDAPAQAFEQCLRGWEMNPADESVRTRLEDLARRAERLPDLLRAWSWEADREDTPSEQRSGALDRTWRLADELGEHATALANLGRRCALHPEDDDLREEWVALALRADLPELWCDAVAEVVATLEEDTHRLAWLPVLLRSSKAAGRPEVSLQALDALLSLAPDEPRWTEERRAVLLEIGRVDTLVQDLENAFAAATTFEEAAEATRELCDVLLRERSDADGAAVRWKALVEAYPDSATARAEREAFLQQQERWEELVDTLLAEGPQPEGTPALRDRALRAARIADEFLGDGELMTAAARVALAEAPDDPEALEVSARACAANGDWEAAIEALTALADALTDTEAARNALAEAATIAESELRDLERAIGLRQAAVERAPGAPEPLLALARTRASAGERAEATALLEDLVNSAEETAPSGPVLAAALFELATLRLADGPPGEAETEAVSLLTRAAQADPANAAVRDLQLRLLGDSGDATGLLRALEERVERAASDEDRAQALYERAAWRVAEVRGWRAALTDLRDSLALQPDAGEPLSLLADVLVHAGHAEEAATLYAELLESFPESDPVSDAAGPVCPGEPVDWPREVRWTLRRAYALERAGRLEEAFDLFMERALDHPDDAAANAGLARVAAAQENLAAAARYARDGLAALPDGDTDGDTPQHAPLRASLHCIIGEAARQEQRADDALRAFLEALGADAGAVQNELDFVFEAALATSDAALRGVALDALASQTVDPATQARALVEAADARHRDGAPREEVLAAVTRALLASQAPEVLDPIFALLDRLDAPEAVERFLTPLIDHAEGAYRGRLLHVRATARQQTDQLPAAFDDAAEAFRVLPHSATILRQLIDLGRASGSTSALAEHLAAFLASAGDAEDTGVVGQVQRALAEILMDDLGHIADARGPLEALRRTFPRDVRVLNRLLTVYEDDSVADDDGALSVASDLVREGALSEPVLRSLERVYFEHDNVDGVLQVLQVQRLAGIADDEALALLESLPASLPELEPGAYAGEFFEEALAPRLIPPAVRQMVERATVAVLPSVVVEPGADWITLPTDAPVQQLFERIREALALPVTLLRLDPSESAPPRALATTEGRTVVLPAKLLDDSLDEALHRFFLTRGLFLAGDAALLLDTLRPFEFMAFLEAALQPIVEDASIADDGLRQRVQEWRTRIGDVDRPEDFAPVARHRLPSAGAWRDILQTSAVEAAVLVSHESRRTFERLCEDAGEALPGNVDALRALMERQPALRAIVGYLLSPRYLSARRRLGLAHGG